MISGHGTIETAVQATKAGAFDFLEKPPSTEKTVLVLANAIRQRSLEAEVLTLKARMRQSHNKTMCETSHCWCCSPGQFI